MSGLCPLCFAQFVLPSCLRYNVDPGKTMIRKAALIDATAIATIHVRTWQAAYAGIIPDEYLAGLSVEKRRDFWRSELTEKRSFVVVAAENEAVVGWARLVFANYPLPTSASSNS